MYRQLFRSLNLLATRQTLSSCSVLQRGTHAFPAISKPAPDFKGQAVINGHFKDIQLSDFKGKYVVLFFYPLDFTFVCPTELIAFNEKLAEFRQLDTEVIGCSTDSVYSHLGKSIVWQAALCVRSSRFVQHGSIHHGSKAAWVAFSIPCSATFPKTSLNATVF